MDASIIKADASRQRAVAGDEVDRHDPALSTRAVLGYLEALHDEALPKNISLTDSQARWTAAPGGLAYFAYATDPRFRLSVVASIARNVQTAK
ncbi:hypothetical protein D9M70_317400 [compost metagenome]